MKYTIVNAVSIEPLEELVANKIAAGWEPLGGAFFAQPFCEKNKCYRSVICQTMIRKEEKAN